MVVSKKTVHKLCVCKCISVCVCVCFSVCVCVCFSVCLFMFQSFHSVGNTTNKAVNNAPLVAGLNAMLSCSPLSSAPH